jgi:hypothetical protein
VLRLKWGDLDSERQMIHLRQVWVGKDRVGELKTEGSAAPVPPGDLRADALHGWNLNTPYAKSNDWVRNADVSDFIDMSEMSDVLWDHAKQILCCTSHGAICLELIESPA